MKQTVVVILVCVTLFLFFAFQDSTSNAGPAAALVNEKQGFYIFTDSRPLLPFDSLGIVELGFVSGTQYESIRDHLISKARKKYASANGLIMAFDKKGLDKAVVIRFK